MADIDYQTLAGAIATSTHGTGVGFGSYSAQVRGLQLVTASGEVLECDAKRNAWRCSMPRGSRWGAGRRDPGAPAEPRGLPPA